MILPRFIKSTPLLLCLGFFLPVDIHAAFYQSWRSEATNGSTAGVYKAAVSGVARNGSTLVAGVLWRNDRAALFISSFDANGAKQWEYTTEEGSHRFRLDGLVAGPFGEAYVAYRHFGDVSCSKIVMVYRGLIWERSEPHVFYNLEPMRQLVMNSEGGLFCYSQEPMSGPTWGSTTLSKIDASGHELWRVQVPFGAEGTWMKGMLALTENGHPIVAGAPKGIGTFDGTNGRVRWMRKNHKTPISAAAIGIGSNSVCVAGRSGYVMYAGGKRIASKRISSNIFDGIMPTKAGGFLLLWKETATLLNRVGRIMWQQSTGLYSLGMFEDSDGGLVVVGYGNSLAFNRFGDEVGEISTQEFDGFENVDLADPGNSVLRASDGTVRVVVNQPYSTGSFRLAAFAPVE